jgi:hypothetical protein
MTDLKRVEPSNDLLGRTLRTVAVLVGACVLFVGSLSTAAVVIASKAAGPAEVDTSSAPSVDDRAAPKSPNKPAATTSRIGVKSQPI